MKTRQLLSKTLFIAAMLFGSSAVFAQVKIGTNPTTIGTTNNLEVEASTTGRKTSIDKTTGQVTIADGTEGSNKIFTSDASGAGSWKALTTTALSSSAQSTPGISFSFPPQNATCFPTAGSPPPACAIDLNHSATFDVRNPTNDVVIDLLENYAIQGNSTALYLNFGIWIDKTTPGVFEYIGGSFLTWPTTTCGSGVITWKKALKNLAVRNGYIIKVYVTPYVNNGTTATVGVGITAGGGCGANNTYPDNQLIVSISQ